MSKRIWPSIATATGTWFDISEQYNKWYKLLIYRNEKAVNINDINGLLIYARGADGTRTRDPRRNKPKNSPKSIYESIT